MVEIRKKKNMKIEKCTWKLKLALRGIQSITPKDKMFLFYLLSIHMEHKTNNDKNVPLKDFPDFYPGCPSPSIPYKLQETRYATYTIGWRYRNWASSPQSAYLHSICVYNAIHKSQKRVEKKNYICSRESGFGGFHSARATCKKKEDCCVEIMSPPLNKIILFYIILILWQ